MEIKYTKHFLNKLEDVLAESEYHLRYEKGNFHAGWCVLHEKKVVLVNKYYTTEGKINTILDLLKNITIESDSLSEKNVKFLAQLGQTQKKLHL